MTDSDSKRPSGNEAVRKPRAALKERAMGEPAGDHLDELWAAVAAGRRVPSNNPYLAVQDGLIWYYASGAAYPQRYSDEAAAALAIARDLAAMPDEPEWTM